MSVSPSILKFLRQADVGYTAFPHPRAYTAKQEAAAAAVPQRNWAKVVTCFADGEPLQAVVPADSDVDFERLGRLIGALEVRMATEDELDWLYPDCETGAMPPFGPLYRQLVYVDEHLADDEMIAFNAGTFANAIAMRFADFERVTRPVIGYFSRPSGNRQ